MTELDPPGYTEETVRALKAMAKGVANDGQQKTALMYVMQVLSGLNDLSYTPETLGGQSATAFREGRRYVGFYIRRIIETPIEVLVPPATKTRARRR